MTAALPVIETERLCLRPFSLADGPDLQRLVGDRAIAATTIMIPHPYPDGEAERWIGTHGERLRSGRGVNFAVTGRADGRLLGSVGLDVTPEHRHAEMGYWIARAEWGRGYATEAAAAVLAFGFDELGLHRIHAHHMAGNPSSGRVLQRIGMHREGVLRQHIVKWDRLEDIVLYGILADERPPPAIR